MKKDAYRYAIVGLLVFAVVGILIAKRKCGSCSLECQINQAVVAETSEVVKAVEAAKVPRLLELGSDKCVPCKMMAPIIDELKEEYAGEVQIDFIDVWKEQDKAGEYGVRVIPTQIFYDKSGQEVFRHEGFFAKEEILKKFEELGIAIKSGSEPDNPVRERE